MDEESFNSVSKRYLEELEANKKLTRLEFGQTKSQSRHQFLRLRESYRFKKLMKNS